ncbi:MAG: hypothetical protein ACREDR_31120, partial [Blastocatellia bacterium]
DLGDGQISWMDESELEGPFFQVTDNSHEYTEAVEYRLDGKLVHRSVHVRLKVGLGIEGRIGGLNGG